jgi:putative flippase GtrA
MIDRAHARQFVRYAAVGLFSTVLNYAIFESGIALGLHYLVATTLSSAIVVVISYFLNRTFTFSSPGRATPREFFSFFMVFSVQYSLAFAGYILLIGYLHLNTSVAFVLNTAFVAVVAFNLLRWGTFRRSRHLQKTTASADQTGARAGSRPMS